MKRKWAVPTGKWTFIVMIFLLMTMLFGSQVFANENIELLNDVTSEIKVRGTNFDFTGQAESILSGKNTQDAAGIFSKIINLFISNVRQNINLLTKMAVLCIVSGIVSIIAEKEASSVCFLSCLALITTMAIGIFKNVLSLAEETIDNLSVFMQSLIPALSVLSQGPYTLMPGGFHTSLFVCMQIIIYACRQWFLPMTLFVSSLSVVNSMTTQFHITKLLETCRLFIKWGIGFLMTIYISFLGISGFGQAVAIGTGAKTVKYAMCTFLPLVGNVLSQSAESVMTGISLIKNAVGIAGILAIAAIVLSPLINILATSVIFRITASVCEPAADKKITKVVSDIAENVSLVFSILLTVCVMFVISIAMLLSVTSGLV